MNSIDGALRAHKETSEGVATECSPLPWREVQGGSMIADRNGMFVAQVTQGISGAGSNKIAANAASIVRAVNSHDALVKALDNLHRCSNAIIGADAQDPSALEAFDMFDAARRQARAALLLAKGTGR